MPAPTALRPACLACLLVFVGFLGAQAPAPQATPPAPAAGDQPLALVHKLTGHEELVYCVAYSPDGKLLATASFDKTLRLWDTATGKLLKTLGGPAGHQNLVLHVAFSPDGTLLASCGSDNTIKLWDVPRGTPLRVFNIEADRLLALAVSPDGNKVATAAANKQVRVWNLGDGKPLANCTGQAAEVTALAFSADGQNLMGVEASGLLRAWNAADGQTIVATPAHQGKGLGAELLPNNQLATAGAEGQIKVWQLPFSSSRILNPPHGGAVTRLALTGDGARLVSASADQTVRVSSAGSFAQERVLPGPASPILDLASAGGTVAALTQDRQVFLWNPADGKPLGQLPAGPFPLSALALQPDGKGLLLGTADGQLLRRTLPLADEKVLAHPAAVTAALASAAGDRLFTAAEDKLVRGWNLGSRQADQQYSGLSAPASILLERSGHLLAGTVEGEIVQWAVGQGTPAVSWGAHSGPITGLFVVAGSDELISISMDGSAKRWRPPASPKATPLPAKPRAAAGAAGAVFLAGEDRKVHRLNLAAGGGTLAFGELPQPIAALAVHADGSKVAVSLADHSLRLLQGSDGKELLNIPALPTACSALALNDPAELLAVAGADGTIRLLKVADGKSVRELVGHAGAVSRLFFHRDRLISQGADKTVRLWNPADGKLLATLDHPAGVTACAAVANQAQFFTGSPDKLLRIWNLADGKPARQFAIQGEPVTLAADGQGFLMGTRDGRVLHHDADGNLLEWSRLGGEPLLVAAGGGTPAEGWLAVTAAGQLLAAKPGLVWASRFAGGLRTGCWLPKLQLLATAGEDKTLKLLRPGDGVAVRLLAGAQAPVTALAVSPDEKLLAAGSADSKLWLWDLAENRPTKALALSGSPARVEFTAEGKGVLVAAGKSLQRWSVASGQAEATVANFPEEVRGFMLAGAKLLAFGSGPLVRELNGDSPKPVPIHQGAVTCLALAGTTQFVSGGADQQVKLWNLADGKELRAFSGPAAPVAALALSRESPPTKLAAAAGKTLFLWSLADGKEQLKLEHAAPLSAIAFSPDSQRLATATQAGRLSIFDVATGQELQALQHPAALASISFSADGRSIIFGGADKTITQAAVSVSKVLAANPAKPAVKVAWSPAGTHAVLALADGECQIFSLTAGKVERTVKVPGGPLAGVAFSKSGQTFVTAGGDNQLRLWNLADGKELKALPAPAKVAGLAFSSGGVLLISGEDKQVRAWNCMHLPGQPLPATFGSALATYPVDTVPTELRFVADGQGFVAGGDASLRQWRLPAEAPRRNIAGHSNIVDALAFRPDGQALASCGHDGTVRLWRVADGAELAQVPTFSAPIYCLAFGKDGKELLTGSFARAAKLIDLEKKTVVREFANLADKAFPRGSYQGPFASVLRKAFPPGHHDGVFSVAFSPEGQPVTASSDGQILVWNREGGVERGLVDSTLPDGGGAGGGRAHRDWINFIRFSPDGTRLVSVGNGGWLKVWNFADGRLLYQQKLPMGLYSVAFAPDGKTLATANHDGTAFILKMP